MAFYESQKIDAQWIKILVVISTLTPLFILIPQLIKDPKPEAIISIVCLMFFLVGIYFLIFQSKAQLRIDSQGLHYKYVPFIWKWRLISWSEMESIKIKTISPLSDYGGWGYKFGIKKTGVILSGERAIEIIRKNQKKFAITLKNEKAAQREIDLYFEKMTK